MKEFFDFMVKNLSEKKVKFINLKGKLEEDPDLLKKGMKTVEPLVRSIFPIKKTQEEAAKVTFAALREEAIEKQRLERMVRKIVEGQ